MNKIAHSMRIICKLAVIAAAVFCSLGLTTTKAVAAAPAERTYYIVYHDDYRNIIRRDPYTTGYTFDAMDPFFWVALPVSNTAWCTAYTEMGSEPVYGATVYNTGDELSTPLTQDLHVYPITSYGTFVRFDSDGGAPFHYQFVHVGRHAENPGSPAKTGYTFDGWYQVLMDEEGHETGLATTTFNFNSWTPVKTETVTPPKEIVIRAKWTPASASYTVHIWLEKADHPQRTSLADAQAHMLEDYTYGTSITKSGNSESNVSFTTTDRNNNAIKDATYFENNRNYFPVFFYPSSTDDEYGSYALQLSNANIQAVNTNGGIDPTGATSVNVFYRRIVYSLTIGYSKNTITSVPSNLNGLSWKSGYDHFTVTIRDSETIGSAIDRATPAITLNENTMQLINTNLGTDNSLVAYWGYQFNNACYGWMTEFGNEGALGNWVYIQDFAYSSGDVNPQTVSDKSKVYLIYSTYTKGSRKFIRDFYTQTLESAKANNENNIRNVNLDHFVKAESWEFLRPSSLNSDGYWNSDYDDGLGYWFCQVVKRNASGSITNHYTSGNTSPNTGYDGHYTYYSDGSTINGYKLELFFLRKAFEVSFVTGTSFVSVKEDDRFKKVFYEESLGEIASLIKKKSDGSAFVIGETYYEDDQHARYIFQGWYDNAAFEGSPVDFDNFKMPAHNVQFYAKWEKQMIDITFDADGGQIQGGDTYVMQIASGQIPYMDDEPVSPDPGRIEFFSWTYEGAYYEFLEPFFEDAKLVALYYADPAKPLKITYKAGAGTGEDVLEFTDYGYLYNANAGVQEFFPDWTEAQGKIFKHWKDEKGKEYDPYDEIYMKHDVTLTAVYEGGHADIVINRDGLLEDETAIFDVFRMVDEVKTFVMRVSLTGTDSEGATVSRKLLNMEPGEYVVEETAWSWAYEKGTTTVKEWQKTATTSSVNGTGTGTVAFNETLEFTFTGNPLTNVTKHGEDAQINKFAPKTTE